MPRNRDRSSPLETKRRLLEEQERLLAQRRRELRQQLESDGSPAAAKIDEPPVWRMEDEPDEPFAEPTPARRRHLARQHRRDRLIAIACIALLLIVIVVVLWVAWVHNVPSSST
jgi:hypothetical protein